MERAKQQKELTERQLEVIQRQITKQTERQMEQLKQLTERTKQRLEQANQRHRCRLGVHRRTGAPAVRGLPNGRWSSR